MLHFKTGSERIICPKNVKAGVLDERLKLFQEYRILEIIFKERNDEVESIIRMLYNINSKIFNFKIKYETK